MRGKAFPPLLPVHTVQMEQGVDTGIDICAGTWMRPSVRVDIFIRIYYLTATLSYDKQQHHGYGMTDPGQLSTQSPQTHLV